MDEYVVVFHNSRAGFTRSYLVNIKARNAQNLITAINKESKDLVAELEKKNPKLSYRLYVHQIIPIKG